MLENGLVGFPDQFKKQNKTKLVQFTKYGSMLNQIEISHTYHGKVMVSKLMIIINDT